MYSSKDIEVGDGVKLSVYAADFAGLNEDTIYHVVDVFGKMVYLEHAEALPIPKDDVTYIGDYYADGLGLKDDSRFDYDDKSVEVVYGLENEISGESMFYDSFLCWFSDAVTRRQDELKEKLLGLAGMPNSQIKTPQEAYAAYNKIENKLDDAQDAVNSYGESFSIEEMLESSIIT